MANTTIRLKKSGVVSNVPASLDLGELALNYADGKLYYKNADGLITYISSGASTNSFATINANTSLVIATSNTDILSLAAANNITITGDGISKTITIGSRLTDVPYENSSSIGASANAVATVYSLLQVTRDSLNYTSNVATDAYTLAGNAYNAANTADGKAQAAFDKANTFGGTSVNVNYLTIEKQLYTANASQTNFYAQYTPPFVTVVINGATVDASEYSTATANTVILNNPASAGDIVDITGFITFNSNTFVGGTSIDPFARETANSASANTITTQGVDAWQNNQITYVNQFAQGAYNAANAAGSSAYVQAAFDTANGANGLAQGAYNKANNALPSTGGTVTGTVTITQDLNVSGNIYVSGNTTTIGTQDLVLDDSLIYLANNNPANIVDIGIVGNFATDHYQHTGIVRNHLDGNWIFFSNISSEPTTTVNFAEANLIYDSITVGGVTAAGNVVINSGISSTSNTTGSLKVSGGVGVTGNVYADKIFVNGLYWAANGNVISTGGSTGTNQFNIYKYVMLNGQTYVAGVDSSGQTLTYTPNAVIVTLNGLTLKPGTDYAATDGSTITLTVAADANDELNIYGFTSTTVNTNTLTTYNYIASAGQTSFGGLDANSNILGYVPGNLFTTLNGITLRNGVDYYAANGTYINLTFSAAANDEVVVYTFGAFNVANTYTTSQADAKFTTASKALAMNFFRS